MNDATALSKRLRDYLLVSSQCTDSLTIQSLCRVYTDSTNELKSWLSATCNIIIECRKCRNFFRCFLHYVHHKENLCGELEQSDSNLNVSTRQLEKNVS
ncbi:hypothetical protein GJ496_003033 [Pomphorhynchus laevis]|nr:hypothetical protein GJ496_003033 [Pomphorhynchus laevis]